MQCECDSKLLTLDIDADNELVCERLLLGDILSGHFSRSLRKCSTHGLQTVLFKILQLEEGRHGKDGSGGKPVWWPEDVLPYKDITVLRHQIDNFIMNWHAILRTILESCGKFYKDYHELKESSMLISTLKLKRVEPIELCHTTSSNLPILDSSTMIPKVDNIHDSTQLEDSKRPDIILDDHHVVRSPSTSTQNGDSSIRIQSGSGSNFSSKPYVLLKDVLLYKYPVYEKDDFMKFLKLESSSIPSTSEEHTENAPRRYPRKIPLSSVRGRKLLASGRYDLKKLNYLRKATWIESFLRKDSRANSTIQMEPTHLSFKQHNSSNHLYKFPRRQQRQKINTRNKLKEAFCRPVEVRLKKMDISPDQMKQLMGIMRVVVDRTAIDKFLESSF